MPHATRGERFQKAVRAGRSQRLDGQELIADVCRRMERWQHLAFFNEPWLMPDNVPVVVRELEGDAS